MQPRQESRVKSLEARASTLEAGIEELSADTAEGLKVIRQENKQIFDHVQSGFHQAHTFVQERFADVNSRLDQMQGNITELKTVQVEQGKKLDQILTLLQNKQD